MVLASLAENEQLPPDGIRAGEAVNRVARQEREALQVSHDVAVIRVQPELVEPEWPGPLRVEPDGAGFGLPELHAGCSLHQRPDQAMRLPPAHLSDQVDAGRD